MHLWRFLSCYLFDTVCICHAQVHQTIRCTNRSSETMASSTTAPVQAPTETHLRPPLILPLDWAIQDGPPDAWMHGNHMPNDADKPPYRSVHVGCMPEIWVAEGTLIFGRWKGYDGQAHWFYHITGHTTRPDDWLTVPPQWFSQLAGF